ncbi:MAG: division/cell wall cluster transcriptional repressor MraZ [Candidatus Nealsonbacteria bacterium]|nr:division/cell wall cluster transcriptional repressor MraZ [Candidatus Nealsonbacteria bacterium]
MEKSIEKCKARNTSMFIGEYSYSIDEKKRLGVPPKFRKLLEEGGVITRGLDNCLFLYSNEEWAKLAKKLSELPLSRADARGFSRIMLSGAMEVNFDNLGRILIPDYLRDYARLKKKVIVAGLYNRIEIWDEDNWNEYKEKTEKEAGDIAERLNEMGV